MTRSTAGRLLVNAALPADLRDDARVLDKKGIEALLQRVAEAHPDQYREVSKRLIALGSEVAYRSGGYTFGLRALRPALAWREANARVEAEVDRILDSDRPDAEKQAAVLAAVSRLTAGTEKGVLDESLADRNPLALQVASGTRGNPLNLRSLRGGDGLYQDHHDRLIPVPITRSYSAGLTPAQYVAGSFGARKGVIDTKLATQEGGFFAKQMVQLAHRLVVSKTDADEDDDPEYAAAHARRGLPVDTADPDNEGALLSFPAGGYPRNTVLTARVLKDLAARGVARIVVRSPLTGGAADGGLYARDVGVRERGGVAPRGDMVGIAAAQAVAEPISQGALGSKHSGGVAGAAKTVSGFKYLNQMIQVPKAFPGGAAHADASGRVGEVAAAPQGGHFVTVAGARHYVPPGLAVLVEPGDEVDAGDVLSEGIPNPAKVVEHKGVGEGRRYFTAAFLRAMRDAGIQGHRRNVELVARGLLNHVEVTEETDDNVPGDVVPYDALERTWRPRPGSRRLRPKAAVGKYLETPVLHYSVGTPVRPAVVRDLEEFGITEVDAHDDPPPFRPRMVRGMENLQHDPDWLTQMLGSNLQKSLAGAVRRGAEADPLGTSYVPALAMNAANFGREGLVRGFDPARPAGGVM